MTIERQIRDYITRNVLFTDGGIEYDDDSSLLAEGILDSMAILELVTWAQKTFGITIEIRDITPENFDSIARLASFIRSKAPGAERYVSAAGSALDEAAA
jgi:acyl carrier protein